MSDIENLNNAFSTALYKKLNNKLVPLSEKINELEFQTQNISLTSGPRGYKGEKGCRGEQGVPGLIGEQGNQGIKGDKGDQGLKGDQGIQGLKGDQGVKGDQGDQGDQGIQGLKGDQGIQGLKGDQGIQGLKGDTGERGEIGKTGSQGIQGKPGKDGKTGPQGIKGDKGDQGVKGDTGERGEIGKTGSQGIQGEIGPKGEAGRDGNDGKDAELPDIDKIIEPHFVKAKEEIDSYVIKSNKELNNWKSAINNQISNNAGGGAIKISQLTDVQQSTAKVDGQFLKYDGTLKKWVGASIDESAETLTTISLNGNSLDYTDENGDTTNISLSGFLDDTTNTVLSASLSGNTITFTREDSTTFDLDVSNLYDDTNLVTSVASRTGDVILTSSDVGLGNVTNESKTTMFTDPIFTGNVGIGTDTSLAKLEIAGSATSTIGVINATNTNFINGTDTPTINARFPTNNASTFGSMSMGKYGTSNNGVGLRFQQVEGTDRLIFRGSSTAGAMVWSQPEASAQLLMDYSNNRSFRFTDDLFTPMRASVNLGGNTSSTRWDNLYANNGYFNNGLNVNNLFVVDSDGNVGIGTSSPSKKLDVVGDIEASGDIQAQTMTVGGAINANTIGGTISTPAQPNITSVGTLTTLTVSNDADFNGNLDVDQTINTTQITAFMGTIGGATFGSSDTSHSYDFVVDTDTFVVDTSENKVGIGTTSPTEKLEVSGDLMLQENGVIKNKNNNTQFRFGLNDLYLDAGHVRAGYSIGIRGQRGSTKGMEQGSTLNSDLGIYCGGNEAISIHSDGDTLVNNDLEVEGTTTVGKITLSDNSFVTETADFTLSETHRGATVLLQNTGPITITVPSQVAGHTTTFIAETSNSVVFTSGTGLSAFNSFNSANQIAGIFGQAQIIFKSSTEAFLGGNVL